MIVIGQKMLISFLEQQLLHVCLSINQSVQHVIL